MKKKSFKVGLDVHGVINSNVKLFSKLINRLRSEAIEVHILTGREYCERLVEELRDLSIRYDQIFSITSYHKTVGTYIKYKDGDITQPLIAPPKWDSTKALYARHVNLDVHIDDSAEYGKYFVHNTQYIRYTPVIEVLFQTLMEDL